ncbi:MAG: hypothetical protein HY918_04840 [Candidatus Doudnabacteria bacterium]|nr:hypothetical protein [Candidatus Doudnabacteria bacterium]
MNPYTYHKPKRMAVAASQDSPSGSPKGGGSWLSNIINAPINSAVALAFVLFAASATAGIAAIASPEIAMDNSSLPATHIVVSRVLGESVTQPVIDDAALEAAEPTGYLIAKPVNFDATLGRWDYKLSYEVANLTGPAVLSIGSYAVQSNITASGTVETGYILKPNRVYRATLWFTDSAGQKVKLARVEIKTDKAQKPGKNDRKPILCPQTQVQGQVASSTPSTKPSLCVKKEDGTLACLPQQCIVPEWKPEDKNASGTSEGLLHKTPLAPIR